jgi:hypothetical protein
MLEGYFCIDPGFIDKIIPEDQEIADKAVLFYFAILMIME